ncbi:GNAT family N-acetyltransferase [Arenimonas sp.]|uniref:GNAT family N-acetyltransferase n=1 Tax=Arenimonas sp. TaxID=1872635 RepID=UPI0035AEFC27
MPDETTLPNSPRSRVRLLSARAAHAGFVCRLYRDAGTMQHLGGPRDRQDAAELARRTLSGASPPGRGQQLWIIQDPATGSPIGLAGLTPKGTATIELGLLLSGEHQGQGYGRATVVALRTAAAGRAPARRLVARHAPGNAAMARLLASLGFERIGTDRDGYVSWRNPDSARTTDAVSAAIG